MDEIEAPTRSTYTEIADRVYKNAEDFRLGFQASRNANLDTANAISFQARAMRTALKKYEKKRKQRNMAARMWRPRVVAAVLAGAAGYNRTAAKLCDKAWRVFVKHYADELGKKRTVKKAS